MNPERIIIIEIDLQKNKYGSQPFKGGLAALSLRLFFGPLLVHFALFPLLRLHEVDELVEPHLVQVIRELACFPVLLEDRSQLLQPLRLV